MRHVDILDVFIAVKTLLSKKKSYKMLIRKEQDFFSQV